MFSIIERAIWIGAFYLFLIGDILTTYIGIKTGLCEERNPYLLIIQRDNGLYTMLMISMVSKTVIFLWSWDMWVNAIVPTHKILFVAIAIVGYATVASNIYQIVKEVLDI